ncbi:hypothetical protein NQ314_011348 [Rhamnusium bicolor]|uniref:Uncharacterized protein n=1 Tax=Rhamnusium bicolor TaxID=1586634 RepID=A0AAV8XIY7_9CUCU|nr:hypothetical protein NQ314_011348 [Rhamnusium bicolor]
MEDSLRHPYHVLLVYLFAMHFSGLVYAMGVICSPLFKNNRELPYKSKYPFDYKASPYYEIIYITQSITLIYIVIECICGIDFLFMAICENVTAQCRLLQQVLLKFGTKEMLDFNRKMELLFDLSGNNNTEKYSTEESKFLYRCIRHHQLLSRVVQKTAKVYQLIAFFQLGFSIISLCLSSVLLTRVSVSK